MNNPFKLSTVASAFTLILSTGAYAASPEIPEPPSVPELIASDSQPLAPVEPAAEAPELAEAPAEASAEDSVTDPAYFNKYSSKYENKYHFGYTYNSGGANINKNIYVNKFVDFDGKVKVKGDIDVHGAVFATVQDQQSNNLNSVYNYENDNSVTIQDDTLNGASGNVGLNVTSGDNNQQDVATALTYFSGGTSNLSADAEVFAYQDDEANYTVNDNINNHVTLGAGVLEGATGNIGVNLASGTNLQQKSNMAISRVDQGVMAEANVTAEQYSDHNSTYNYETTNEVVINGSVLAGAAGNVSLNATVGTGNQQATHLSVASN